MKSTILRSAAALACALGLAACGGGGDQNIQGSVQNVTEDGLVLQNNGGDDTPVVSPYTYFQFNKRVNNDDMYNITFKSYPPNIDHCEVLGGYGSGHANYYTISRIQVYCYFKTWPLNVQVKGLMTNGLVIVNGTDKVPVTPSNPPGDLIVPMAKVDQDTAYGVTILTQPAGQTCKVSGGGSGNGSGMTGAGPVDNVVVTCS